jgi:hypothetical protein
VVGSAIRGLGIFRNIYIYTHALPTAESMCRSRFSCSSDADARAHLCLPVRWRAAAVAVAACRPVAPVDAPGPWAPSPIDDDKSR